MRTIIAGSRNCIDKGQLLATLATCGWTPSVIISGAARGADRFGEIWAIENNIPCERFPADWERYGKTAGYRRNEQMVNNAEALIALWDGKSRGTKHMIDIAQKKGMQTYHKIQTIFKRDMNNKGKILEGQWSLPEFEYLAENQWIFTEKVDGMNIRIMCAPSPFFSFIYREDRISYRVIFGGKTDAAQIPAFLVSRLEQRFHTVEQRQKLAKIFPDGACLYGEGYGAKIQKGSGNYRKDQDFVLFDCAG